jgi:large conductance mechanosensitive channel
LPSTNPPISPRTFGLVSSRIVGLASSQAMSRLGPGANPAAGTGDSRSQTQSDTAMLKEFKEFALKGNMVDLAVGIIIGVAFNSVVQSLVKDVVMAAIGGLIKLDFNQWVLPLLPRGKGMDVKAMQEAGIPYIAYGSFITVLINFVILAFVIFLVVKAFNRARKVFEKEQEQKPAEAPPDVKLLTEIRDLLAKKPV